MTQEEKAVLVSFEDGKIIIEKSKYLTLITNIDIIALSEEAGKSDEWKGDYRMLEVMDEMAISEKAMKLLMNFVKDDLKEARDSEDIEKKNSKIDRVLEHIQQYLED